jgi:hypothetical protein
MQLLMMPRRLESIYQSVIMGQLIMHGKHLTPDHLIDAMEVLY